jgi:hypothetical protein
MVSGMMVINVDIGQVRVPMGISRPGESTMVSGIKR